MRALVIAICLAAGAANAGESGVTVRQLAGISASVSDSGFGLGAQLGVQISPLLLRVTFDVGGGNGRRGYILASARADWLYPIGSGDAAFLVGAGVGGLSYGFIFDSPTGTVSALIPEIGLLLGNNRSIGRTLIGIAGFIPLSPLSHARDFAGQEIVPPHLMATLVLSL